MTSSHSLFAKSPAQAQFTTPPIEFTEELLDRIRRHRYINPHLNLASQPVGVNEVAALIEALSEDAFDSVIKSIDLTGCSPRDDNAIGAEGCQLLAKWLRAGRGKSLLLGGNAIGDKGVMALVHDRSEIYHFTLLDLSNNDITIAGVKALLLRYDIINTLSLSGNKLNDNSGVELADMITSAGNRFRLASLNLSHTDVGDGTVIAFSKMTDKNILALDLSHTQITDKGARALLSSGLTCINLEGCKISPFLLSQINIHIENNRARQQQHEELERERNLFTA